MPTVGFKIGRDSSALLSSSCNEPIIALSGIPTRSCGWDDFAIDFSDFARHWGGAPFLE